MRNAKMVGGLCVCAVAGWVVAGAAQSALSALGVQEANAKREIVYAISSGHVNVYPARQAFKAAAPAARAGLVNAALSWAKAYTETPAFKADYDRRRAENAPRPPKPTSVDAELAKQKAEQEKSIAEAKKSLAQMPPEMRAQMEATIKQLEATFAQQNADPQMAGMRRQGLEMQAAEEQRSYKESVVRHEKLYPADPRVLIADRLRQFLDVSKDVDFNARLVASNGRNRFENPAYERQSADWKLCYRAGRESVDAARQFAQAWLASLK